MPIYMDLHIIPGVTAKDVASAHLMDLMIENEHNCKCMTYWVDEARGQVFCLIDAPEKEVVAELHAKAHGLVPHKIIEVQTSLVESFLGRVSDPEDAEVNNEGLKLINDPSYRILLVIKMDDPVLLQCKAGKEKAADVLQKARQLIRHQLSECGGQEAEHEGSAIIASFTSAQKAIACATALNNKLSKVNGLTNFKIGIHSGEPVTKNDRLFGDTIYLAECMCFIDRDAPIAISSSVKQLSKGLEESNPVYFTLGPEDEQLLTSLFKALDLNWQESDFNMDDYCQEMAMSQSRLYRKTLALTGYSPNALLKEYRLEKALELLKKKPYNISQITFDAGFSSPSYFTKCFKKKYDVLPMAYLDMLNQ